MLIEMPNQSLERALQDFRIRVEEEDVTRVGGFQRSVVRVPEAAVHAPDDARLRKLIADEGGSSVGRLVIGDDHVEGACAATGEDARKARSQPTRLVRRDHDYRKVVHGDLLII